MNSHQFLNPRLVSLTCYSEMNSLHQGWMCRHLTFVQSLVSIGQKCYEQSPVVGVAKAQYFPLVTAVLLSADCQQVDAVATLKVPCYLKSDMKEKLLM